MGRFRNKAIACGMSVVLAVGLTPLPAFANSGSELSAASLQISLQAGEKASIYDCDITLRSAYTHIYDGKAYTPEVAVTYYGKTLKKGTDYTVKYKRYGSSDAVTPKEVGSYSVEVTGIGQYQYSTTRTFYIEKENAWSGVSAQLTNVKSNFAYTGKAIKPAVSVVRYGKALKAGTDYTVSYQKNKYNYSYVYDDEDFVDATPKEVGYYRIVIKPAGKYASDGASPEYVGFSIFDAKNLGSARVYWPNGSNIAYTGKKLAPKPVVILNGKELTYKTDYTIKYQQNGKDVTPKEVGEYSIVIEGAGKYKGTAEKPSTAYSYFDVYAGNNLGDSKYTQVRFPNGSRYAYTGKAITPKPVVTYKGKTLTLNKDYTIKYDTDKPINPGNYYAEVVGKGNYSGVSYEGSFYIYSKTDLSDATITMPNNGNGSYAYTGKPLSVKPSKVELYGKALKAGKDYTIAYRLDGTWINKPTQIGNYTMYIIGKGSYAGQFRTCSFRIVEKNNLSAATIIMPDSYDYTGKKIKPNPVVFLNGAKLRLNKDYTISYYGDVNGTYSGMKKITSPKSAGEYIAIIAPKGSKYMGTKNVNFTIAATDLNSDGYSVSLKNSTLIYSGKAKNPTVIVKKGKKKLKDSNYDVSYAASPIYPGFYTVTVSGKKNLTGKVSLDYVVNPANEKIAKLTAKKKSFVVKWKKSENGSKGYQVRYSLNKNMSGAKVKTVKKATTDNLTVKKLKSKKTYYVQVRTKYKVGSTTLYGNWSKAKAVKVK